MSKFDHHKIMPRYSVIAIIMTLTAVAVLAKAFYTMTAGKEYWKAVANRLVVENKPVPPARGNILSCDGQLMASSLPVYNIFMDFNALHEAGNDSLWDAKLDSICMGLHAIFPEQPVDSFRANLEKGKELMSKHWPIWKPRINYSTFCEVKTLPVFSMPSYKGGFHIDKFDSRRRPFGSLAQRTVGDMYARQDGPRCGLELSYDSILRGPNGVKHRRKVRNKYLDIIDTPPIDGADIVTTIDVGMQDLAERALLDELEEINANVGVAIVMEVATGDVKAIVNMEKKNDGTYGEIQNHAVSDLLEPGSVFKTAALMVALDDGVCDTNEVVETGGGIYNMYGRDMKDHNWHRGGYGTMRLPKTLMVSSNIGVSRIIDKYYHNCPEKFVQGIYDLGLAEDLKIPIVGSTPARIRMPKKNERGQYLNWSKTALPWMSIGYETQVPPISTLTFYNAIANNGKMMRPRFVKQVVKNGEVLMEFPPQVVKEQIAKPQTIQEMQVILEHVVSQGLGKKAGSQTFKVAGKTGTAQMAKGGGYHTGVTNYLVSFAGFFPADQPRYSCIVCIQKSGLPASGGSMSGPVFRRIAEGIMAQDLKLDVKDAHDLTSIVVPSVKSGNLLAADYVLNYFGFKVDNGWEGTHAVGDPIWGIIEQRNQKFSAIKRANQGAGTIPDVTGMGARDAVYLLESCGVKVKVDGRGKVTEQSIDAGKKITPGMVCTLKLC